MHRKDAHANVTPMLNRGKQFGPFAGYKEKNWIRPLILWSLHKLVDYLVLHWGLTLLAEWSNTPYEYVEWLLAWGFGDISTVLCLWLHTSMSLLSRSAIVVNILNANDPEISR